MTPTDEQQEIIASTRAGGSLMIPAYAGCAKTTTLELASKEVRDGALALAFNKSIAEELKKRFPGNFLVKTMNGLGYGAWSKQIGKKLQLDDKKLGRLTSHVTGQNNRRKGKKEEDNFWPEIRQMAEAAMQAGISPGDEGEPLISDTPEAWVELADEMLLTDAEMDRVIPKAQEVLRLSVEEAKLGIISFDDMVYCPTVLGGRWTRFATVMCDEAQDLSPLNHRMLELSSRPDGRLIVCGDPKQAIYGFRGAHEQSMGQIRQLKPEWTDRQLTLTFRCPKRIVQRQLAHAPGYRAAESNVEGEVARIMRPDIIVPEAPPWGGWDEKILSPQPGEAGPAILCRNNGPLLSMAFKLIRRQIGVMMLGRDIGKGLVGLLNKLVPDDEADANDIIGKVLDWKEKECALAVAKGLEEKIAYVSDRAESLLASLEGSGARTKKELREAIEVLFAKTNAQVTLGTIHKSKGLEWDHVVHLDPWRIPSKYAKNDPGQMAQEWNLKYVCETRTKRRLTEVDLDDWAG